MTIRSLASCVSGETPMQGWGISATFPKTVFGKVVVFSSALAFHLHLGRRQWK
jgi:hypothetical protein